MQPVNHIIFWIVASVVVGASIVTALGWIWLIVVAFIVLVVMLLSGEDRVNKTSAWSVAEIDIVPELVLSNDQDRFHLESARDAWEAGDFDRARREYLKTAYGVTRNGPEQMKPLLKVEQTNFIRSDTFTQDIIARVVEIIKDEPGILQTKLYTVLPYQKEDIQTALYFGHELGDFVREKKGRSYAVTPIQA